MRRACQGLQKQPQKKLCRPPPLQVFMIYGRSNYTLPPYGCQLWQLEKNNGTWSKRNESLHQEKEKKKRIKDKWTFHNTSSLCWRGNCFECVCAPQLQALSQTKAITLLTPPSCL